MSVLRKKPPAQHMQQLAANSTLAVAPDGDAKPVILTKKTGNTLGLTSESRGIVHAPVNEVLENPLNHRQYYSPSDVEERAQSIQKVGQLEAALGFVGDDGRITLIEGHTRRRAIIRLGMPTIRIELVARPESDLDLYLISRRVNKERNNGNPIDDALGFKRLLDRGLVEDQDSLSVLIGVSQGYISKTLALAALPPRIIQSVIEVPSLLTVKALYQLHLYYEASGLEDTLDLIAVAERQGLSSRDIEVARNLLNKSPRAIPRSERNTFVLGAKKGELRRFDSDGRLEFSIKGLEPDVLLRLEKHLVDAVTQVIESLNTTT